MILTFPALLCGWSNVRRDRPGNFASRHFDCCEDRTHNFWPPLGFVKSLRGGWKFYNPDGISKRLSIFVLSCQRLARHLLLGVLDEVGQGPVGREFDQSSRPTRPLLNLVLQEAQGFGYAPVSPPVAALIAIQ